MSQSPAIEVDGLEKSYREGFWLKSSKVLHGISFSVPRGQIFGFLGANGAGKTTTIKIALGFQAADRGRVSLLGRPAEETASRELIGYLPERPYFQNNLTAGEFLDFHRGLFPAKRSRRDNEELFKLVGLPGIGSHYLRNFSKGMLQRIGIAQSLVGDPELLILDEPMSGLDPVGRRDMRSLILTLNRDGKTIFFSSHIISDVEALCSRIAFLEKGQMKFFGQLEEILGGESQQFEIFFRLPAGHRVPGAEAVGDRYRLTVSGAANAQIALNDCLAKGVEVISFSPIHRSLESVLFGSGGDT